MMLSALMWRRCNGSIRMYTDVIGADYYTRLGLIDLWNDGIDTAVLEQTQWDINPRSFWSAGKVLSMAAETSPCVMMDTDFIVWFPLLLLTRPHDLIVIHREQIWEAIYVPQTALKTARGYTFDSNWSWEEPACNTAFVSIGHEEFRRNYTSEALRFMHKNAEESPVASAQTVFAEQRLLAMCARKSGLTIHSLLPDSGDWNRQHQFTHLWGHKAVLRRDPIERRTFCLQCVARIRRDFPHEAAMLEGIAELHPYL